MMPSYGIACSGAALASMRATASIAPGYETADLQLAQALWMEMTFSVDGAFCSIACDGAALASVRSPACIAA